MKKWMAGLCLLGAFSAGAAGPSSPKGFAEAGRPNVVLIFADDLDFDEIGTYDPAEYPTYTSAKNSGFENRGSWGYYPKPPSTPNIDRIAGNGLKFTRFYVPITTCTPSRYCLLSGQRAGRSAAIQKEFKSTQTARVEFNANLHPSEWNIARALQSTGYKTGFIGKFHLIEGRDLEKLLPAGSMAVKDLKKVKEPVPDSVLADLKTRYNIYCDHIRKNYGFDFVDGLYIQNTSQTGIPDIWRKPEGNMEWMTYNALRFIEQNKDEPFFLEFAPNIPHGMFGANALQGANRRATPAGLLDEHVGTQPSFEDIFKRIAEQGLDASAAMPMYLDDGIGVILNKLKQLGLDENTLVIFTSDHQSRGKWTVYEAAHVPALAMWPGKIKPGRVTDQFCSTLDLAPTLLDLCGAPAPAATEATLDGRSIKEVLLSEKATLPDEPFLIEFGYAKAILYQNWKYIVLRFPEDDPAMMKQIARRSGERPDYRGKSHVTDATLTVFPNMLVTEQLYDLNADPFEQNNRVGDERAAAKIAEMRDYMSTAVKDLPNRFGEF